MNGIKSWSFKNQNIANGFDSHVREQLPWYELATKAVEFIARNYLSEGGTVYDIGASTGNISLALDSLIRERSARLIAVEESWQMVAKYRGHGTMIPANALDVAYENFDVAIFFLTFMFLPIAKRQGFLQQLIQRMNKGGAIIMVEKVNPKDGYVGSVIRRMTMNWKMMAGASPEEIIKKDLSLCGVQRPVCPSEIGQATEFFKMGEFVGWIIEKEQPKDASCLNKSAT